MIHSIWRSTDLWPCGNTPACPASWLPLQGWKVSLMSESSAEAGGYKECVLQITGDRCWGSERLREGQDWAGKSPAACNYHLLHNAAVSLAALLVVFLWQLCPIRAVVSKCCRGSTQLGSITCLPYTQFAAAAHAQGQPKRYQPVCGPPTTPPYPVLPFRLSAECTASSSTSLVCTVCSGCRPLRLRAECTLPQQQWRSCRRWMMWM